MPRRNDSKQVTGGSLPQKHSLPVDPYEIPDDPVSLKRTRRGVQQKEDEVREDVINDTDTEMRDGYKEGATPIKKRRGRPPREDPTESPNVKISTTPATSRQKNSIQTPLKLNGLNGIDTPSRRNIADRSARRKSARALIDRVVDGAISDDEGEDEGIAREIYESSEDDEPQQQDQDQESAEDGEDGPVAITPSKRRGRPPGSGRKRSPTPPQDLPPHEQYFYQNKPGRAKTSNNSLSSLDLLTHDEYFALLRKTKPTHTTNIQFLESLHAESFSQWYFELSQGFTTCLYGYGSKRRLLHQFATYISTKTQPTPPTKIVIVNGYLRTTSIREILSTLGTAIQPSHRIPSGNPVSMVQTLFRLLSSSPSPLTLIINSIDAPPLRKPATQSILAQLAAHPKISLACSADTSDFPLLWDSGLRSSFSFLFHDCTTFAPFGPEIEVVDEVHELLGRMARRVGGKEGVTFVLRSLPENAKSLFRLLVTEVLVAMDEGGGGGHAESVGIEYRMMYNKAVEEFICSSEMAFRTLLKEFHDHQIIESQKDSIGTELLSLPFRKDELESILEDLVS